MKIVSSHRASRVLYNFLKSNFDGCSLPWLLPANICDCVPETFDAAGVKYEYVDISAETWCIDFAQVMDNISNYSGVLYVHTYGVEETPLAIFAEIKRRNPQICIIDDRCLCMPRFSNNNAIVDVELYSLGAKKQVSCGGGYSLINKGICLKQEVSADSFLFGDEWVFDEQKIKLKYIEIMTHKMNINAIYRQLLPNDIQMHDAFQKWRFNILVENRDEILKAIFDAGLFASAHYKPQTPNMPNAAYLHQHVINLFEDEYISIEQAKAICKIVNEKLMK